VTIEKDFDSMELMETTQGTFSHSLWENPMGEASKAGSGTEDHSGGVPT